MLSKLRQIVSEISEKEGLVIQPWNMEKVKTIERNLNDDGDIETAMTKLERLLGYRWDKFFKQILEELERNKK